MRMRSPYDFRRSLRVIHSFSKTPEPDRGDLKIGFRFGGKPAVLTVSPRPRFRGELDLSSSAPVPAADLEALTRWVLFDELDLRPFYRMVGSHPVFRPILVKLRGVKPMRPASLLEMAVIVITEQQISLAAAQRIRLRLVERYGDLVGGIWVFPEAGTLARARLETMRHCGYSQRKAEYIRDFAAMVASGALDLDALKSWPEEKVYERLLGIRGWGPWSADYFLVRGLARPDRIPADDLALRAVVGKYLGRGARISAEKVEELIAPFRPYRGLASFYLEAHDRLS